MSVTTQAIPAADLTARAADSPLVIGRNLLQIAYLQAITQLVTNEVGNLATGDASASGFDRRKLTQRFKHVLWKGNSPGNPWYVVIDTGTDEQWTDALVIGPGHNLTGLTAVVEADSTTPSGDPWGTTVLSGTIVAGMNVLLHASLMTKARYWRISIDGASTPEATSFWLGKAVQFPTWPLLSSDAPNSFRGAASEVETKSGIPYRYVEHGALIERSLAWKVDEHNEGTFLGTDLEDFFTNSNALNGGHSNFVYVDKPNSAPNSGFICRLTEPTYRPVLRKRGSGDAGFSTFGMRIKEVGG